MTPTTVTALDVLRTRSSARRFLPTPLPADDIRAVLEDAQRAPSNSNTQPWVVHLVSGATRDTLAERLSAAFDGGETTPDFTGDYGGGRYLRRSHDHSAAVYGSMGIERSDHHGRQRAVRRNLDFYGAPHTALLFMPMLGDGVRAAGDVGMYAQNFLLSLTARGYRGIPQTMIGHYADTVRDVLDIPADLKLLFAISFGRADETEPTNDLVMDRVPLHESVTVHDTPGVLPAP
ncbi:nitroreductase [Nocardioides alkalitolerans]|uniref:nitroreductase n=1 Tax=Nocardioides alkalitolerans TaxID=281714 RepID=UPI00041713A0|nr:nitroreductase [Nocardioides alkalitolerans]